MSQKCIYGSETAGNGHFWVFRGPGGGFRGPGKPCFQGFPVYPPPGPSETPPGPPPGPLRDQNRCKTAPIPKTKKKFLYTFCTLWALFCTFSAKCRRIIHLLEATFFTPGAVLASSKQVGFFRPRILKQRRNLHFGVEKLHLFELAVFIKIMVKSGFGV